MLVPDHIARSLTLEELANRLQDHDELAVRELARQALELMDDYPACEPGVPA